MIFSLNSNIVELNLIDNYQIELFNVPNMIEMLLPNNIIGLFYDNYRRPTEKKY